MPVFLLNIIGPFVQLLLLFSHSVVFDSFRPMDCSTPVFPLLYCLLVSAQAHVHSCHPTISSSVAHFSSCPQSFLESGVFSNELSLCIRQPKCLSFTFSISPSSEHSGFPGGSVGNEPACSPGFDPSSGRSPEEGNGYPLPYSFQETSMDRRACQATAHGVAKSLT